MHCKLYHRSSCSKLTWCLLWIFLHSQPLGYCLSKLEHNSQSDEGKITLLEICMDSEAVRSCVSTDRGQLLATCLWSCLTAAQTSSDKPMQTVSLNVPVGMVDTDSVREAMRQLQISVESVSSRMDAGFMFMLLESSTLPQSAQQRLQEHSERECGEDQPKPEQMLFSSAPTFSRLDLFWGMMNETCHWQSYIMLTFIPVCHEQVTYLKQGIDVFSVSPHGVHDNTHMTFERSVSIIWSLSTGTPCFWSSGAPK